MQIIEYKLDNNKIIEEIIEVGNPYLFFKNKKENYLEISFQSNSHFGKRISSALTYLTISNKKYFVSPLYYSSIIGNRNYQSKIDGISYQRYYIKDVIKTGDINFFKEKISEKDSEIFFDVLYWSAIEETFPDILTSIDLLEKYKINNFTSFYENDLPIKSAKSFCKYIIHKKTDNKLSDTFLHIKDILEKEKNKKTNSIKSNNLSINSFM